MSTSDRSTSPAGWIRLQDDLIGSAPDLLAPHSEHVRLVLEASDTGLWTWDLDTDNVSWSPECYRIHGVTLDEKPACAADFFELVHPADQQRVERTVRAAIEARTLYECEFRIVRPGGETVWVQNRGRATCDDQGRPVCVFGTITDIQARKRADEALRQRERELQIVADTMPDVLARFDRELRHVFVNAAASRASGRTREELLGRTNRELGMPDHLCDLWDVALLKTFEKKEQSEIGFEFNGRLFLSRLAPEVDADGHVAHVVAIVTDVTQLRAAERAQRDANRRKDEFLATLAHEWRNHLAPVRYSIGLLQRMGLPPGPAIRSVQILDRQAEHLARLVDDLLDVASIGQGKVRLTLQDMDLRTVIETAVEASRPLLDAQRHQLDVQIPHAPVAVRVDAARTVQVFVNLLNNAAKYTPPGGLVQVNVIAQEGWATARVADNGLGIPPDMLSSVFDLFAQVPAHRAQAQGGLGLGLPLVRRLVELQGGTVDVHSDGANQGAAFTVRLPIAGGNPSQAAG